MKPVYLEMNYFGPHAHSEIDFRALDEAPLFLISGDTGAGKSTIFDAMTYALFDKTTGDREAKEMRSQFAQPDQLTEVTFYFEQGNFLYKVTRRPEQEVFKKRGQGTTSSKAQASLSIVDTVFGLERANLASKTADVCTEIEHLLNLTADQFKKIILLPQNDFSQFLKSRTQDKEKILKKIFGTAIFTTFSEEIHDQYAKVTQENEAYNAILQSQYSSSVWSPEELEELEACPDNEKFHKAKAFLEEKQTQEKNARIQAQSAHKKLAEMDKVYEAALHLEQIYIDQEKTEAEYQEKIISQAAFYEQQKEEYAARVWANQLKDSVHDLEGLEEELEENQKREASYRINVEEEKQALEKVKARESLLKEQSAAFDKKNKIIEELTSKIPQAEYVENLMAQKKRLEEGLQELQQQVKETDKPYQEAKDKLKKLQEEILDAELLQAEKDELSQMNLEVHSQLTPLEVSLQRIETEKQAAQSAFEMSKKEAEKLKQELLAKQADYIEKRKLRQGLMIAQLQKELEEGLPCKVCGSVEHPLAQETVEVSDAELKEAMSQVDRAQEAFAAAEERQGTAQKEVELTQKQAAEKEREYEECKNSLEQAYSCFCQTYEGSFPKQYDGQELNLTLRLLENKLTEKIRKNQSLKLEQEAASTLLAELDRERQDKNIEIEKGRTQIEAAAENLAAFGQLPSSQSLKSQKAELSQAVDNYYAECQTLQQKLKELEKKYAEQKAKHDERIEQIKEQKIKIQNISSKILGTLQAPDAWTSDLEILKKWIAEDKLPEISKFINTYELEAQRLTKELERQKQDLGDKERPSLQQLQDEKQALNEIYHSAQKELVGLENTCKQLQATVNKIEEVLEEQGNAAAYGREITKLYNVVAGKTGDKLKLETFVVQHYLVKVLEYANRHFINQLSNNRYRFELTKEAANKRQDHGLDISIYDNETGSSRSSNTLSGGETFIAALSIALALSEVVQNSAQGVQIEALFVDEGFGSLDQETLQKAMIALEQIGENRLVGLISHVEEMKDSIAQQLLIEKLGDGRSQVRLFSK